MTTTELPFLINSVLCPCCSLFGFTYPILFLLSGGHWIHCCDLGLDHCTTGLQQCHSLGFLTSFPPTSNLFPMKPRELPFTNMPLIGSLLNHKAQLISHSLQSGSDSSALRVRLFATFVANHVSLTPPTAGPCMSHFVQCRFITVLMRGCRNLTLIYISEPVVKAGFIICCFIAVLRTYCQHSVKTYCT